MTLELWNMLKYWNMTLELWNMPWEHVIRTANTTSYNNCTRDSLQPSTRLALLELQKIHSVLVHWVHWVIKVHWVHMVHRVHRVLGFHHHVPLVHWVLGVHKVLKKNTL
jgi:hypothetical protein